MHASKLDVTNLSRTESSLLRLFPCDPDNDLEQFYFVLGGSIHPQTDTDLCMVWRGVNPDVGIDPIIFRECDEIKEAEQ